MTGAVELAAGSVSVEPAVTLIGMTTITDLLKGLDETELLDITRHSSWKPD
jgi:hypothetical protein